MDKKIENNIKYSKEKIHDDYVAWRQEFIDKYDIKDIFEETRPYDIALVYGMLDYLTTGFAEKEVVDKIIVIAEKQKANLYDFFINESYKSKNGFDVKDYRAAQYFLEDIILNYEED